MKKRIISVTAAMLLLVGMLTACGNDGAGESTGGKASSEDLFYWSGNIIAGLTEKGMKQKTLVIPARCEGFAAGALTEGADQLEFVSFESDKDIVLGEALCGSDSIREVRLPAELTTITDQEFWRCESLETVNFPDSLTSIGEKAFEDCVSLTAVEMGSQVVSIGECAFKGCINLEKLTLSDTVETIGESAFVECEKITELQVPSALRTVGPFGLFFGAVTDFYFPESVELEQIDSTSFIQLTPSTRMHVKCESWMDQNFDAAMGQTDGAVKVEE